MTVTNSISPDIDFKEGEWIKRELTNFDILEKLVETKTQGFLNFPWRNFRNSARGYARGNLLTLLRLYDDRAVYCDTDSIKILKPYDKSIIDRYNENVRKKLLNISKELNLDFSLYEPTDIKGKKHLIRSI